MDPSNLIKESAIQIIINIALALIISYSLGPLAILISKRLGAIDIPGSAKHKRHSVPTPLAGGVVISIAIPVLFFISGLWKEKILYPLFLGGGIVFLFGILDDIYGFSASKKFLGQFLAALIIIYSGNTIRFLENTNVPLGISGITILNWGLTLFWVVGITNAFNLIDSMDGLVSGLTIIIASFLTFITFVAGQTILSQFSAILVGVSIALYLYNKSPARFFLGDSGSQVLGFLLATLAIIYRPPDLNPGSTWFVPILLLGVPIFDTSLVVVSRLRRHKPVFQADRSHTYHRLVQMGFSSKQAVFVIQIMAFLLSLLAFLAMFLSPNIAMTLFFLAFALGAVLIIFFEVSIEIE